MGQSDRSVTNIYMYIPITRFAIVTVALPAISLAYCFISAFLFRHDEVNDTDCSNYSHLVPSISGVTGIQPQVYIWRICVGLHSAPRFLVGFMYFNYYKGRLAHVEHKGLVRFLMSLCFWLYTTECFTLLAVSCISNRENYPLHEKIFVVFMVCSIAHQVFHTVLYGRTRYKSMTELEKKSYFWKRAMLTVISLSTIGLLRYFYLHRVFCQPGAFSVFSTFEYFIAYANIGYHFTALYDFDDQAIMSGCLCDDRTNGYTAAMNGTKRQTNGSAKPAKGAVMNEKRKRE